jgi:hypothetical protein
MGPSLPIIDETTRHWGAFSLFEVQGIDTQYWSSIFLLPQELILPNLWQLLHRIWPLPPPDLLVRDADRVFDRSFHLASPCQDWPSHHQLSLDYFGPRPCCCHCRRDGSRYLLNSKGDDHG